MGNCNFGALVGYTWINIILHIEESWILLLEERFFFRRYYCSDHMKYELGNRSPPGNDTRGPPAPMAAAILILSWFIIRGFNPAWGPKGIIIGLPWKIFKIIFCQKRFLNSKVSYNFGIWRVFQLFIFYK